MSRTRLVDEVVRGTTVVLLVTLLVVGGATGLLLHVQRVRALDEALVAAAHAHARPGAPGEWEIEHSRSPVDVRVWVPGDPEVDVTTAAAVVYRERPAFMTIGNRRVLMLPVELERSGDGEEHRVVVASAQRPTFVRTTGPFLLVYGATALVAGGAAAAGQRRLVSRSLAAVSRAGAEVAHVTTAGQGARVTEDGPDEVRELLAAVNALLARLDRAFSAQARFTAEAAHELRTPVTAMLGEIDVAIRRSRAPEEYERVLRSVRDDVLRLGRLVEGLMALARVDSGQADADRSLEPAADLARRALQLERASLDRAGCSVLLEVDTAAVVRVHEPLVLAAIANLLRNAAMHAPGGPVALRVAEYGGRVRFEVHDTGPGIPDAARDAVFDRFARGGEARRRADGLGLGLPFAREVARRHGGECRIEDAPTGARVIVELPIATDP